MSHPSQTPDPGKPQDPIVNPVPGGQNITWNPHSQAEAGQQHAQQYAPHLPGYSSGQQFSGGYGYGGQPIDPSTGQPYPPYGYQPQPQKSNGLAIASLIIGVVALALAWIPIVNYVAMVLGLIALVLGGIGIFQSHRMMSIIGAALGLVAIVASFAVYAAFVNSVNTAVDDYNSATSAIPSDPALTDPDLGYEGEGYPYEDEALPSDSEAAPSPYNERGNIPKAIGEDAGVTNFDGTVDVVSWTVSDVKTDISCTEPYQSAEPTGHLTAVDLSVTTSAGFDELTGGYAALSGYDWTFIDSAGTTHEDLETLATYSCLADSATFNDGSLGAGQTYKGKVVLELPDTEGTLVFTPHFDTYDSTGWEYPVG